MYKYTKETTVYINTYIYKGLKNELEEVYIC